MEAEAKQSLLYRWDVMDFTEVEETRPEFRGDECINTATGKVESTIPGVHQKKEKLCGLPVVITFSV